MAKVYVVVGTSEEEWQGGTCKWDVAAFLDRSAALEFCERLNRFLTETGCHTECPVTLPEWTVLEVILEEGRKLDWKMVINQSETSYGVSELELRG